MSRKLLVGLLVLALVLSAAGAWAQGAGLTARYSAMGGAGLALANDAGALGLNPAGLGMQSLSYLGNPSGWGAPVAPPAGQGYRSYSQIAVTDRLSDGGADNGLDYAGVNNTAWGWGLSYHHQDFADARSDDLAAGVSYDLKYNLSLGLAWHNEFSRAGDSSDSSNVFDAGAIWRCPCRYSPRVALTFDGMGTDSKLITNVCVALPYNASGGLLLDWDDVFCEYNGHLNIGTEYWLGARQNWAVRAGLANLDADHGNALWTAGAGYRSQAWQFDFSWMQAPDESSAPVDETRAAALSSATNDNDTLKCTLSFGF